LKKSKNATALLNAVSVADATAKRDVISSEKYPNLSTDKAHRHPVRPLKWDFAEQKYLKLLKKSIMESSLIIPEELEYV